MFNPLLFLNFWRRYPAFFCGLFFFMGCLAALSTTSLWLIPLLVLWLPFGCVIIHTRSKTSLESFLLSLLLFFTAWIYTASQVEKPFIPQEGLRGVGRMVISSLHQVVTPFDKSWVYEGSLHDFRPSLAAPPIAAHLPCKIRWKEEDSGIVRPKACFDYSVEGVLKLDKKGDYHLKMGKKSSWKPIENSWSFAEMRFSWKKQAAAWIDSHISTQTSASFLKGLLTGDFDDYWMKKQFGRFGLQHLLAISGFHFAIIASFLALLCRFLYPASFFSIKWPTLTLLLLLASYAFFLGGEPSILRSWIMCSLALLSSLFEKRHSALNAIGAAAFLVLAYNPFFALHLGFQLSFAITATILLLFPIGVKKIYWLFPKRTLRDLLSMNLFNQIGYCLLVFFANALALTWVVTFAALPLTLYYFQKFPWMSLIYNLFFPFLASFSLIFLLAAGALFFLPFLAAWIHHVNDYYTFYLLQLTYQAPLALDAYLTIDSLSLFWVTCYFSFLLAATIAMQERLDDEENQTHGFNFI